MENNKRIEIQSEIESALLFRKKKRAQKMIFELGDSRVRQYWQALFHIRFREKTKYHLYQELLKELTNKNAQKYILSLAFIILRLREKPSQLTKEDINHFKIIEEYKRKSLYGHYFLIYYYWIEKKQSQLLKNYQKMVELSPRNDDLLFLVSYSLFLVHMNQESLMYLRKARPSIRKIYYYLAYFVWRYKFGGLVFVVLLVWLIFSIRFPYNVIPLIFITPCTLCALIKRDSLGRAFFIPITGAMLFAEILTIFQAFS